VKEELLHELELANLIAGGSGCVIPEYSTKISKRVSYMHKKTDLARRPEFVSLLSGSGKTYRTESWGLNV